MMAITITDLRNWLGTTYTSILTDTQLTAALARANRYCAGYMSARGVAGSGNAYDAAVEAASHGEVCFQLDSMGIKPSSLSTDAHSEGADVLGTGRYWYDLADKSLVDAVLASAGNKRDLYIRHVRGGRGI
jgi:hypothetical protein